jgi:hypothetical protein
MSAPVGNKKGAIRGEKRNAEVTTVNDPAQVDICELALAVYPVADIATGPAKRIQAMTDQGFHTDLLQDHRCRSLFKAIQTRVEAGKITDLTHAAEMTDIDFSAILEAADSTYDHQLPGRIAELRERDRARRIGRIIKQAASMDPDTAVEFMLQAIGDLDGGNQTSKPRSLVEFANMRIDDAETLLGRRYLCRGGAMLFVGPSGVGKSSASCQQDLAWAAGLPAFGIEPSGPLKILCYQAENDDGDQTEMAVGVMAGLGLSPEQTALAAANTLYVTAFEAGAAFLARVRRDVQKYRPDLIRIDPLNAFLGDDAKDPKAIANFCRAGLNEILHKYRCGAIVCHHTPKTNFRGDTSNWSSVDWSYAAAGGADLTNWARSVLTIDAINAEDGLFKLIASKRGNRIGWINGTRERFVAYSREPGVIFWRDADEVQTARLANPKAERVPEDAIDHIPEVGTLGKATAIENIRAALGIGEKKAATFVKILLERGSIHEHKIKRSGKRDAVEIGRARPKQTEAI